MTMAAAAGSATGTSGKLPTSGKVPGRD